MYALCLRFHWNLFLRIQLTIFQHWWGKWLGNDQQLSQPMIVRLLMHVCVTRPQCIKNTTSFCMDMACTHWVKLCLDFVYRNLSMIMHNKSLNISYPYGIRKIFSGLLRSKMCADCLANIHLMFCHYRWYTLITKALYTQGRDLGSTFEW